MKVPIRLLVFALVTLGLIAGTAGAQAEPDQRRKMAPLFQSPNARVNSGLGSGGLCVPGLLRRYFGHVWGQRSPDLQHL